MAKTVSPEKHFFDQGFQDKEKQLSLFIQLSKNQVLLAYFHKKDNSFVGFSEYKLGAHDNWQQAFSSIKAVFSSIDKHYKSLSVALVDPNFTIVPKPLFSPVATKDYLAFSHGEAKYAVTHHHQSIESANACILFAIPSQLEQIIKSFFSNCQLLHYSQPLLEYSEIIKDPIIAELQLHIQDRHFEVIYYKLGKLNFFNSFTYQSAEDLLYFLLYTMEQLKIDRKEVPIYLYGEFEKNGSIYQLLEKYIKNIQLVAPPKELQFSTVLSKFPNYYYRNLYNQYLCE